MEPGVGSRVMLRRWWSGRAPLTRVSLVLTVPAYLLAMSIMSSWIFSGALPPVEQVLLVVALFGVVLILAIPTHFAQRRHELDAIVRRAWVEEAEEAAQSSSGPDRRSSNLHD